MSNCFYATINKQKMLNHFVAEKKYIYIKNKPKYHNPNESFSFILLCCVSLCMTVDVFCAMD